MATRYARSTDGNDADDGSTWALAKATLTGVAAIDAAGDRIYVSQSHAESTAGAVTLAFAGTLAAPTQLICGNDAAEPPTAVAATGTVATTGANAISISGTLYAYGLGFTAGSSTSSAGLSLNTASGDAQKYEACNFVLGGANASGRINANIAGTSNAQSLSLRNCGIKFAHASQTMNVTYATHINGGSLLSGGTSPSVLFTPVSQRPINLLVDGFDLSNASAGINLVTGGVSANGKAVFRNCKLPASWSGSLLSSAITYSGFRAEMWNCDSASTNYEMWIEDYYGSIKHETTLVKTGGASDGTTPLAWKMASSANASYTAPLCSPEIASAWIDSTGSAKTITVDILHDSATNLKDDEVWVEVAYLSDSGSPKSSLVADAKADILATGADQTASSATWTTTGMTNPNKQKLAVSFTPQQKGVALVKVCLAKASATVYVDPVAQVS